MTGTVIERLVIEVAHEVDSGSLDKARAEARAAAEEIRKEFDLTADDVADAVDKIAKDNEDAAGKSSEVWTGALRRIGEKLTDFTADGAQALAGFVADTFSEVRELDTFALSIGKSTTELMALEKGFERARVPADKTREAIKTLTENLGELERIGTGPALDSLGSLGLELEDIAGRGPEETLEILADALAGVENEAKRTSIAIELMGDDGRAIMPAMLDGATGVRALTDAAREAGQVIDEETIAKTRELDDALLSMKGKAEGVALTLITRSLPALTDVAEGTEAWFDENEELIGQNMPKVIDAIAIAITALADSFLWATEKAAGLGDVLFDLQQWEKDADKWLGLSDEGSSGFEFAPGMQEKAEAVSRQNAENRGRQSAGSTLGEAVGAAQALYERAQDPDIRAEFSRRVTEADKRRAKGAAFEDGIKNPGRGGKREDPELTQGRKDAEFTGLADELRKLGDKYGATTKAIETSIESVARSFAGGASQGVARKRGLSSLGGLVGKDLSKSASQDPISELLGIDTLPDTSPAEMSNGQLPHVLTATFNNAFDLKLNFQIDGAARPDLIPDQIVDAVTDLFETHTAKAATYGKVILAR